MPLHVLQIVHALSVCMLSCISCTWLLRRAGADVRVHVQLAHTCSEVRCWKPTEHDEHAKDSIERKPK